MKVFLEWAKANCEVYNNLPFEEGIVFHVSDDRKKLVGRIGECRLLYMYRHFICPCWLVSTLADRAVWASAASP